MSPTGDPRGGAGGGSGRRGWAFVRKELRVLLRDRKAILLSIVLPILIYPAIFAFTTHLEREAEEKAREEVYQVAVTGPADLLRDALAAADGLEIVEAADPETLRNRIREGTLHAWVDALEGIAARGGDVPEIRLHYHRPREESREARDRVVEILEDVRREERERRYRRAGGAGRLADLLAVGEVDVATEEEAGGAAAGRQVPLFLMMTLFIGAASLSVDIVAGEKERGTLETLYLTPVDRHEIAGAKFLVVTAAAVVTGALNLASLLACYRLGWIGEGGGGIAVSTAGIAVSFVLIFPLAALVGAVLLGISSFARSLKEAQFYVTPVMLVAIVPGMLASSQDVPLDSFTALIPVANVALAIRDGLHGRVPIPLVALVFAASAAWAALAVRWTAGVLSREDTILGFAPEPLFARTPSGRRRAALLGMAVTVLGFFYAGQLLQARSLPTGLALSLWVLLPGLGALTLRFAWSGGSWPEVLSMRRASAAPLAGAALLAGGVFLPMLRGVTVLQAHFLPVPEDFLAEFEKLTEMSPALQLFLISFSPGVCEELVFRGAFLGLLRRVGTTRSAIVTSSMFFALIHLSVFRFLPTFLLGLVLAGLVVRTRSLLPAMIFHMTYNALALQAGELVQEIPGGIGGVTAAWGVSLVLLAVGWGLVRATPRRKVAGTG